MRSGRASFALQCSLGCAGPFSRRLAFPAALAFRQIALGLSARPVGCTASLRRRQFHAGAARFREANRDGLLWRSCAVLAFANVLHLFANKFTCLCTGGFAFARIFASALDGLLFWHRVLLE